LIDAETVARSTPAEKKPARWICVSGPLDIDDRALKYPPTQREPFSDVFDAVRDRKPAVIHGPYHSGKTTLLRALEKKLRNADIKTVFLTMRRVVEPNVTDTENEVDRFYEYFSHGVFGASIPSKDFKNKLEFEYTDAENNRDQRPDCICLLIDDFQGLLYTKRLEQEATSFFEFLSETRIPWVGVGTFLLKSLDWKSILNRDGQPSLVRLPGFNKASFHHLPPLSEEEMGKILRRYERDFSRRISEDLKARIKSDSGGHAASLMALLKLHNECRPTLENWNVTLEQQYRRYMNGVRFKIEEDLTDKPDLCRLVRVLLGYGCEKWQEDIDKVINQQRRGRAAKLGTLLDMGILSVFDLDSIGFTSKLIHRACIDIVFPRRMIRLRRDEIEGSSSW
jgi:ATPase domain predominantly from Archaea